MKKLIVGMAALISMVFPAMAAEVPYNQQFVNQVVTTTTSFILDNNAYGVDAISFQATVSSATPTVKTFTDGHVSSGTITVSNFAGLIAQASSDTITVATNSALSPTAGSDQVFFTNINGISGSSFTIVTSSSKTFVWGITLSSTATSSGTAAANFATVINTNADNVSAVAVGSTVTITCKSNGSFCNSYSLSSTTNTVTVSAAKFSGGNDNASFAITDPVRTRIFYQGSEWLQQDKASNTAISIMNTINAQNIFTASTVTATSVLIVGDKLKSTGNLFTLTASTAALSVASLNFVGGQDNASLCIAATCLAQGKDFTAVTSSAVTANAISAAINANSTLNQIVTSTAPLACGLSSPCGVIYATGTIITSGGFNYVLYTTTGALNLSSATLLGGVNSSYALNTTKIIIPSHGYATGEGVVYTAGAVPITGISNSSTYFVGVVDSNDIGLAATSTGALAGVYITLASTSTTGAHTYTLTPSALTGTAVLSWSQSNDGVNFSTAAATAFNSTIATMTLNSPWVPTNQGWDFGSVDYRYLRLTVTGPATAGSGGFNTVVTGYGKRYWR